MMVNLRLFQHRCLPALVSLLLWLFSIPAAAIIQEDGSVAVPNHNNIGTMLMTLQSNLEEVWAMLMAACWMMGIVLFVLGMLKLKKFGQQTVFMMAQADLMGPLMRILVGTLLIYAPWTLNTMLATLWADQEGGTLSSIQGYRSSGGASAADLMGPVFTMVQVIGFVAFIRGMLQVTKVGEQGAQPGQVPRALMLIFGGVLCININGTIDVAMATLGITST